MSFTGLTPLNPTRGELRKDVFPGCAIAEPGMGRLEAVIGSGNSPQKHVWRARIVLLSADGVGTMAIQRQTGKGKPTIWRWQARFMAEGVDGLLHEATRPAGKPPLTPAVIERVVEMTLAEPPGETTHWTGRAMAKAAGVSHRSVQRIWAAHGLQAAPGARPSSCRTIRSLPPRCRMSSASMSIRPSTRWCCRSTRSRMCGWPPTLQGKRLS